MKGTIRIAVGFLITFGAVGTLDYDPTASVVTQGLMAMIGVAILFSGIQAMNKEHYRGF